MEMLAALPGMLGSAGSAIGSAAGSIGSTLESLPGVSQGITAATGLYNSPGAFFNGLMGMGAPGTGGIAGPPNPGTALAGGGGGHPFLNMLLTGANMMNPGSNGGAPRAPAGMPLGARSSPPFLQGAMPTAYQRMNPNGGQRSIVSLIGNQQPMQLGA